MTVSVCVCSAPGSGPEWYLVRVEVTVLDVNDNVPEWIMAPSPYLAVVSPDAPAGSLVYKLHAKDGDEGNNGEVEYFLSDGRSFLQQVKFFSFFFVFCMQIERCGRMVVGSPNVLFFPSK